MLLIPLLCSGCLFHVLTSAAESFLPQPFIHFVLMLLDLHHAEETVLHHSTTQKCDLVMATFYSIAFVPPDGCALDLWLSRWIASGFFSGEYRSILRLEILLSLP